MFILKLKIAGIKFYVAKVDSIVASKKNFPPKKVVLKKSVFKQDQITHFAILYPLRLSLFLFLTMSPAIPDVRTSATRRLRDPCGCKNDVAQLKEDLINLKRKLNAGSKNKRKSERIGRNPIMCVRKLLRITCYTILISIHEIESY